jgi:hypothetical protein
MQLMVGERAGAADLHLSEDVAQFGGGKAGPDNGTMEAVVELPNSTPARRMSGYSVQPIDGGSWKLRFAALTYYLPHPPRWRLGGGA